MTYNSYGTLQEFLFNDKFDEIGAGGIYLYGARFYDPAIDRYMSEDTDTGSLDDPMSQNRYVYASDNPLSIVDPNGHDSWWSSITSAVSNAVSDVATGVNAISTTAYNLASDVSNAWNSLPSSEQADIVTAGVDISAAAAIVVTGGSILATPAGGALVGAAISSTAYTIESGSDATWQGVAGAAVSGAISGGVGLGISSAGLTGIAAIGLGAAANAGASVLGSDVTASLSGNAPTVDPINVAIAATVGGVVGQSGLGASTVLKSGLLKADVSLGSYGNLFAVDTNPTIARGIPSLIDIAGGGVATALTSHFFSTLSRNIGEVGVARSIRMIR